MSTTLKSPLRTPGWLSELSLACFVVLFTPSIQAADAWGAISEPLLERLTNSGAKLPWPGGCSGVVANRTNGEVTVKVVGSGLWRSADKGNTWHRIDAGTVTGRDETGWATTVDQNVPFRMASFSLDGLAGWTANGSSWKSFASLGRNWDYGSVDWSGSNPCTIIAAKHETNPPGEVYVSTDGGVTWRRLPIHLNEHREQISMVGALDASTFVYSKGDGIWRSNDTGATWTKVSPINPQTRIPVLFIGTHYLGTAVGLLVSTDKGQSWHALGASVNIWLGPFFGGDDQKMVIIGTEGVFLTKDAGQTWTRVAGLKPPGSGFAFSSNWFGCYAWDPVNSLLYASAMGNSLFVLELHLD